MNFFWSEFFTCSGDWHQESTGVKTREKTWHRKICRIHQGANSMHKSSALDSAWCCTDLLQSSLNYLPFMKCHLDHGHHNITRAQFALHPKCRSVILPPTDVTIQTSIIQAINFDTLSWTMLTILSFSTSKIAGQHWLGIRGFSELNFFCWSQVCIELWAIKSQEMGHLQRFLWASLNMCCSIWPS